MKSIKSLKKINFDNINTCSEVKKDNEKFPNANPDAFHFCARKAKALIEQYRHDFAQSLNTLPTELYFASNSLIQSINLINFLILFSDITDVFTSIFEREEYLNFLKNLEKTGKIKLHLIKTGDFGEIELKEFQKQIARTKGKSLVSLSHANEYNGLLIPVKEITKICTTQNTLFLLNIKPTIGKYSIDLEKLAPDFAIMDLSEHCGGRNSGVFYMKQTVKISDSNFHHLKNVLLSTENKDAESIYKLTKSLKYTKQYLTENYEIISNLKKYLIEQFRKHFDLEPVTAGYQKEGIYTLLSYFIPENRFGNYIAQKLDIENIYVGKIDYPVKKEEKGSFLRFSLNTNSSKNNIKKLVEVLWALHTKIQ